MNTELTEEEMRRALFGSSEVSASAGSAAAKDPAPQMVVELLPKPAVKRKVAKAFTPRLKVTLRVGNIFEGETQEIIHEADTMSSLLAEQEATRSARKKFRYVEVVSVKPIL